MKLDKTKPFGVVCGIHEQGARYEQGGLLFLGDGSLLPGQKVPRATPKPAPAPAAKAKPAAKQTLAEATEAEAAHEANNANDF